MLSTWHQSLAAVQRMQFPLPALRSRAPIFRVWSDYPTDERQEACVILSTQDIRVKSNATLWCRTWWSNIILLWNSWTPCPLNRPRKRCPSDGINASVSSKLVRSVLRSNEIYPAQIPPLPTFYRTPTSKSDHIHRTLFFDSDAGGLIVRFITWQWALVLHSPDTHDQSSSHVSWIAYI